MQEILRSGNTATMASAIRDAINKDKQAPLKDRMREGVNYYKYEHDILNYRLFYFDSTGTLREETTRSNVRIPHAFFTELVDQKVQYLLSNPIEFCVDDEVFQQRLDEYTGDNFQMQLQELLEGASKKAIEYIYPYKDINNRLAFQVVDSLTLIPIYNENNEIIAYVRYYETEISKDGRTRTVTRAELWDDEKVWYFVTDDNGNFNLDAKKELNPKPHLVMRHMGTDELIGKGWGFLPFFELKNNKAQKTDLEPIKGLIDDYDLMACSLSNNLEDFQEALYVVKGYDGDDLDKLTKNIKTRKTVGVNEGGDVDVKEINIPYEARKVKIDLDKEGIYKFGMGFDSTLVGDGNITNVVIKSRYTLLDMKCRKVEIRLRKLLRELLELIVQDINELNGTSYHVRDIEIKITRSTIANETEKIEDKKTEEEARQILIENILSVADRIDIDSVLSLICEAMELDFEDVQAALNTQDYRQNLNSASEPNE